MMANKVWIGFKGGILVFVLVMAMAGIVLSAETVELVGTVSPDYQIMTDDDEIYEVGETAKGDELMDFVDRRVRVLGTVDEAEDGTKIIQVMEFQVLEE